MNARMKYTSLLLIIAVVILTAGCAKNYRIRYGLEQPLPAGATISVGEITDLLPIDMDENNKPTFEDVAKFRRVLSEELAKQDNLNFTSFAGNLVVEGTILEWNKGSGVARAFLPFGIGKARLSIKLTLIDSQTKQILFGGNFDEVVTSYVESGDETFKRIAKNFVKQLCKQIEKLEG